MSSRGEMGVPTFDAESKTTWHLNSLFLLGWGGGVQTFDTESKTI